jgi:thymidine phosphorylase
MAREGGIVTGIDTRAVGLAVIGLGGGRRAPDDAIDHSVGFAEVAAPGDRVGPGERHLAIVHARTEADAERAAEQLRAAVTLGEAAPAAGPVVAETVAG